MLGNWPGLGGSNIVLKELIGVMKMKEFKVIHPTSGGTFGYVLASNESEAMKIAREVYGFSRFGYIVVEV